MNKKRGDHVTKTKVDLLIHSAAQLISCGGADGPRRGEVMGQVELIADGAIAAQDGRIVAVGPSAESAHRSRLRQRHEGATAAGTVVLIVAVSCERIVETDLWQHGLEIVHLHL